LDPGEIDRAQVRASIWERFPVRVVAGFSFAVGGLLLLKCLGEIVPTLGSSNMPANATGYYTLVDQALDLGLLVPFCILTGVLLLKRDSLGYLLSSSSLIIFVTIGLSVIAGEILLGKSIGQINITGVTIFIIFVCIAIALLSIVLESIKEIRPIGS